MKKQQKFLPHFLALSFCFALTGCTPTVQLETPKEGITINMNVVVDHKIEVKMDERAKAVISTVESEESK